MLSTISNKVSSYVNSTINFSIPGNRSDSFVLKTIRFHLILAISYFGELLLPQNFIQTEIPTTPLKFRTKIH